MSIDLYAVIAGVVALLYAAWLTRSVLSLPAGEGKMKGIALAIQEGAKAYLIRQYTVITWIGVVVFIVLGFALNWMIALGFLVLRRRAGALGRLRVLRAHRRY
ncbi:MAG: K(+)-insensitive pyrophosphate-energized proton pump [Parcubacteria group bacterium GW2011_GWA2_56_7]|nr:MAG: K(+)-insensitive pyrophosphate-energized proton pump [Parcubacteria group bacterium GW2011_GWA2_56_7]